MRALLPAPFRDRPDRAALATAWIAWVVLTVVACVYTAHKIEKRPQNPLANRTEEFASRQWWSEGDLYRPFDQPFFLYLPHAAILYTPFHAGPDVARNLFVRIVYLGLFAWALFVFAGLGDPERRSLRFLLMTVVCLPLTADSIRAGQANVPLAALLMLASVAIARGRWTWATVCLALGVAIKPLGVVWLLLAGGMWPRTMAWRVAIAIVALAAFPFAFGAPAYVARQYADFFHKMTIESDPERRFSDVGGVVWALFHVELPYLLLLAIRGFAALGTLALGLLARRRWDRTGAAVALNVLGAFYLVLFNPKTEGPTYTLLAPALGVLLAFTALELRNAWLSLLLVGVAYGLALTYEIWGHHMYWWQPLLTCVGLVVACVPLVRGRSWLPAPSA